MKDTDTDTSEKYMTASITNQLIKSFKLHARKKKNQMNIILSKASVFHPRYQILKFLSNDQKSLIWKQLEN